MNIIEVNNLNFSYDSVHTIKIPYFYVKKGDFVCITGKNVSSKTTLLKLLGGFIKTENMIKLDNICINSLNSELIDKKVEYLFYENTFFSKTVYDELSMYINGINKRGKIKKILSNFNMDKYINTSPSLLSYIDSQKLVLIKVLLKKPKIIFMDNPFSKLDSLSRRKLYSLLKDYAKENNITIIATLNTLEDSKYYNRLIVLEKNKILLDGTPNEVYKEEKILSKIGLKLPYIYELSNKLKLYDLIDREIYNEEELVDYLC